jgi:hypothetical protein
MKEIVLEIGSDYTTSADIYKLSVAEIQGLIEFLVYVRSCKIKWTKSGPDTWDAEEVKAWESGFTLESPIFQVVRRLAVNV